MDVSHNFHGSDLEKIEQAYGIKKETIINFSSNVNPLGLSQSIKAYLPRNIELIASYPDRDYTSLRKTISEYVNTDPSFVSVGNGSTELISLCIKAVAPKKAIIICPTYSEYEREISLYDGSCIYYELKEENDFKVDFKVLREKLAEDIDLLIICNPNNPTSSFIPLKDMEMILEDCREKNIFVMVDETYIEFVSNTSNASSIALVRQFENLFVIRGVSKFFAAPGLRLGYAVCSHPYFMEKINGHKNPWTINALAAFAGELMLRDEEYISRTKELITNERKRIINVMSDWSFVKFFEPAANFILVKILNDKVTAKMLFGQLLAQKMMIRDASSFPFLEGEFFRFCILKPENNDKLLAEIERILGDTLK